MDVEMSLEALESKGFKGFGVLKVWLLEFPWNVLQYRIISLFIGRIASKKLTEHLIFD